MNEYANEVKRLKYLSYKYNKNIDLINSAYVNENLRKSYIAELTTILTEMVTTHNELSAKIDMLQKSMIPNC